MNYLYTKFLLIILCIQLSLSCYIHGTDSGICVNLTLDSDWKHINMPYCKHAVQYTACIPKQLYNIPPTLEFPDGRWSNHTTATKDEWIRLTTGHFISTRTGIEKSSTINHDPPHVKRRFRKRPNCQHAYKSFMCYANFPRCDISRDLSFPVCRSVCENYFRSCHYEYGLWRCGRSQYFNGYEPESPSLNSLGNTTYLRDYFPGQPFRENKYNKNGDEEPICTPAITGTATSTYHLSLIWLFISIIMSTSLISFIN